MTLKRHRNFSTSGTCDAAAPREVDEVGTHPSSITFSGRIISTKHRPNQRKRVQTLHTCDSLGSQARLSSPDGTKEDMPPSTVSASSSGSASSSLAKGPLAKPPVKLPCWCGDDCQCCIIPCVSKTKLRKCRVVSDVLTLVFQSVM
jgi:hypothetical protein